MKGKPGRIATMHAKYRQSRQLSPESCNREERAATPFVAPGLIRGPRSSIPDSPPSSGKPAVISEPRERYPGARDSGSGTANTHRADHRLPIAVHLGIIKIMNNGDKRIESTFENANDRAEVTAPAHRRSTPNPSSQE